jgi:hypothetical protein
LFIKGQVSRNVKNIVTNISVFPCTISYDLGNYLCYTESNSDGDAPRKL